jgi:DNA-binding NarL/FixJ family response regulator
METAERPLNPEAGEAGSSDTPRLVIADGDMATRAGIRVALEREGMRVCAEVVSLEALLTVVADHEPDVVLVSGDLQDGALRAIAAITALPAQPAVVVLASRVDEDLLIDAIRVGASGYIDKSITAPSLAAAVRAVLQGEPAIPRALVGVLMDRMRERVARRQLSIPHRRAVDLTSREWEVLDLMRAGGSTREIAERLVISEITVRRHIGSILKKLQVASRRDAIKLLQSA